MRTAATKLGTRYILMALRKVCNHPALFDEVFDLFYCRCMDTTSESMPSFHFAQQDEINDDNTSKPKRKAALAAVSRIERFKDVLLDDSDLLALCKDDEDEEESDEE